MALPLLQAMNIYDLEMSVAYYRRLYFQVVGADVSQKHPHAEMLGKFASLASDNLVALKNYGSFFMKTMAMNNTAAAFLMNNSIFVEPKKEEQPVDKATCEQGQLDEEVSKERRRRKYKMGCPNGEYSKQDKAALKICVGDDISFKDTTAGKRLYAQPGKK